MKGRLSFMRDLEGLSIFLMGASGGMGSATALRLARPGVKLAICSIDGPGIDALAAKLRDKGAAVFKRRVDLTVEEETAAFFDDAVAEFGTADILLNYSGVSIGGNIEEFEYEKFQAILDVNLKTMFLGCKHFVRLADPDRYPMIINFGSMGAKRANAKSPYYCMAKAGILMFDDCLAQQLKAKNIRVTTMNPGPTDTSFFDGKLDKDKRVNFMQAEDVAEIIEFILTRNRRIVYHSLFFECYENFKAMGGGGFESLKFNQK